MGDNETSSTRTSLPLAPRAGAAIDEMVRRIVAQFDPVQVILFGSHARGTAGPDSDVDLLVVLPQISSRRKTNLDVRVALRGMGIGKDILVMTPEEVQADRNIPGTIVRPALREGIVLYERG